MLHKYRLLTQINRPKSKSNDCRSGEKTGQFINPRGGSLL